jgi:DNA-binding SARP family transcriptional activator
MLSVQLFGKFRLQLRDGKEYNFKPGKGQELLAFLLLQHPRVHARETLAGVLWEHLPPVQALKNLRQTLWQLRVGLEEVAETALLTVDNESVGLSRDVQLGLDVALFKGSADGVEGVAGRALSSEQFAKLEQAVKIYRADLLEGWYYDWCIYEREYLQRLFIILLDKLIGYCQEHQHYEIGIQYGERILRYDVAHERTHRKLIYLHHLAGDRTGAIRQYHRCRDALLEELGVEPARSTTELYEQIRADRLRLPAFYTMPMPAVGPEEEAISAVLADVLDRLQQIHSLILRAE